MPKKKEKFLLVFTLIVFFAAGIFALWQSGFFENIFSKKFLSKEAEQQWRREQEQFVASLIKTGNITSCDDVNYESADGIDYSIVCKNNIALKKAQENLDIEWCKKLDGKLISVENCEREILFSKMSKENSIAVCDSAPSELLKTECKGIYWMQKSVSDKNIALCGNSSATETKNRCEINYYIENLIKSPQTADCSKFTNENQKRDCETYQSITKNSVQSFNECSRLANPRLEFACERLR